MILTDEQIAKAKSETPESALDIRCTGCNRKPAEIDEYIEAAAETAAPERYPDEYVREEEGTYNPFNGHFLCTDCYIKAGMPSAGVGKGTWVAA